MIFTDIFMKTYILLCIHMCIIIFFFLLFLPLFSSSFFLLFPHFFFSCFSPFLLFAPCFSHKQLWKKKEKKKRKYLLVLRVADHDWPLITRGRGGLSTTDPLRCKRTAISRYCPRAHASSFRGHSLFSSAN